MKKVNLAKLLGLRASFHTIPLFYLRSYVRKNYATVKIHPYICCSVIVLQKTKRTNDITSLLSQ